jgi:hypothetical protein
MELQIAEIAPILVPRPEPTDPVRNLFDADRFILVIILYFQGISRYQGSVLVVDQFQNMAINNDLERSVPT